MAETKEHHQETVWNEIKPVLDEELTRLPEKYRAPLILCYFEGKTNEEAAQMLGWPSGSMSRRLEKGRNLLKNRLSERNVVVSVSLLTTLLSEKAWLDVPVKSIQILGKASMLIAKQHELTASGVSQHKRSHFQKELLI